MNNASSFDPARVYLGAHASSISFTQAARSPGGPYITISRESGAGGSTLARMLADHLIGAPAMDSGRPRWTVFDQNLVDEMLEQEHLSPRLARFLPEAKVSEITTVVREIVGLHPSIWMLTEKTNHLMRELARRGHVILVGRGASFATAGVARGLRLRLVGSPEYRARQTARREHLSLPDALAHNRRVDADRRKYVRATFGADVTRADAYDLILNTGQFSFNELVAMTAPLIRARSLAPATSTVRA